MISELSSRNFKVTGALRKTKIPDLSLRTRKSKVTGWISRKTVLSGFVARKTRNSRVTGWFACGNLEEPVNLELQVGFSEKNVAFGLQNSGFQLQNEVLGLENNSAQLQNNTSGLQNSGFP